MNPISNIVSYKLNTRKTSPLAELLVSLENTYHDDQNDTIFKFCWERQNGEMKPSDQREAFNVKPRSWTVIIHGPWISALLGGLDRLFTKLPSWRGSSDEISLARQILSISR